MRRFLFLLLFILVSTLSFCLVERRFNILFSSNYIPYAQGVFSNFEPNSMEHAEDDWFNVQLFALEMLINGELGSEFGRQIYLTENIKIMGDLGLWAKVVRGALGVTFKGGIGLGSVELFGGGDLYYDSHYLGNILAYELFNVDNVVWDSGIGLGVKAGIRYNTTENSFWETSYSYGFNGSPSFFNIAYGFSFSWEAFTNPEEPIIDDVPTPIVSDV